MIIGSFTTFYSFAQPSNSTNATGNSKPVDFLVYENSTFGIKINYPKNWALGTLPPDPPLTNVVIFYSPENDDYVDVSIDTYDYSNTKIDTVKELLKESISSYTSFPDDFKDFKLLASSSNKALAGLPAYMLEAEYQDPEFGKTMILETGILKDQINYIISYYASPSQYKYYIPIVQSMIKSFEIK